MGLPERSVIVVELVITKLIWVFRSLGFPVVRIRPIGSTEAIRSVVTVEEGTRDGRCTIMIKAFAWGGMLLVIAAEMTASTRVPRRREQGLMLWPRAFSTTVLGPIFNRIVCSEPGRFVLRGLWEIRILLWEPEQDTSSTIALSMRKKLPKRETIPWSSLDIRNLIATGISFLLYV